MGGGRAFVLICSFCSRVYFRFILCLRLLLLICSGVLIVCLFWDRLTYRVFVLASLIVRPFVLARVLFILFVLCVCIVLNQIRPVREGSGLS